MLLVEYIPLNYDQNQILTEAASNPSAPIKVKAILQRANAENQNKRKYPKEILVREATKYDVEFVKQRRALGELDHPERAVVELHNVSHNITEMHWEGDDLMGTIEILSTPAGNIVKELMKNGIRLGISSRGVGSVKDLGEGVVEVDEDYTLICFDLVSNPSTQGAFLTEGKKIENSYNSIENLIYDFLLELKH
jgi:Kyanoviridae head maturation protease